MSFLDAQKFFNDLSFFTLSNSAPELGKFFKDTITISSPKTKIINLEEWKSEDEKMVFSKISFNKGDVGDTFVLFRENDALKLAKYALERRLNKEMRDLTWDDFSINAIEEIVNILGGNMTEILTVVFGKGVDIEVPELEFKNKNEFDMFSDSESLVLNSFTLYFGNGNKVKMHELAKKGYYEELVKELKNRI